ncbi:MAG: hypothetical protein EKK48_19370 [Candidatus Melainabacteria bacterium]|nr:MAG: hypothetical protein EKK48_19370 [Candidatus Melainabacteria bacterium]
MSEGEVAKPAPKKSDDRSAAVGDGGQESARLKLTTEAGLADPKNSAGGEKKPTEGQQCTVKDSGNSELVFTPIAGFDAERHERSGDQAVRAAHRSYKKLPDGSLELGHGDRSRVIKEANGAISDQGDVNGQHYDITASKDKDSIVWKDKDGKEHRFERKKGENHNEYVDGDGTTLVQNGDKNTITFKGGYQVDIDARTGRTIIQHDQKEIAQYNGKDAVRRQLDDNNVAFQVRGDVSTTVDQIKDYQRRTGQPQHGNMLIKNEKGDTVVLQEDGTEITRKADSKTVSIKRGDTVVEYTPGQEPKIISGADHITRNNGGLQIDGKEMLTKDGCVAISGMKDGRLDSSHGRIYGTTDQGGQVDLGTGRAIADSLTTTNTGSGVEATTADGRTILKTGPDSKQIQSGPVTTNVDQDHPTTTVHGSDGSTININNVDGSSKITDSNGTEIANINGNGDVCTWDGTFLGADGEIFNADMDLSGWTSFDADGPSSFSSSDSDSGAYEARQATANAVSNSTTAVTSADTICSNARALANNLDASPGTLSQIDSGIDNLGAAAAQLTALLPFNPALVEQLYAVNQSWAKLQDIRSVVQNQVAVQNLLNQQYGTSPKGVIANAVGMGGTPQAVELAAERYQLPQTA